MAVPNSRETLKEYCLRRLGHPVIKINVDDDQLEDRIDDALQKYKRYHYDGVEQMYIPHQITSTDVQFKYLPIDPAIERITKIIPLNSEGNITSMFSFDYQFRLNDMRHLITAPVTNYVITQSHLQLLHNIFVGEISFEYNKATQRLFLEQKWGEKLKEGDWIVAECYVAVDPDVATAVYNDSWLKSYTTQLFKRQWGEQMKKFGNLEIPGGIILNGKEVYDEASESIEKLEEELETKYQPPPMFLVG